MGFEQMLKRKKHLPPLRHAQGAFDMLRGRSTCSGGVRQAQGAFDKLRGHRQAQESERPENSP